MTITLNENEWARSMIASKSLGKQPAETLTRVARYYIDNNYPKREVRKMLGNFLLQCDPTASLPKWSDLLDRAVDRAMNNEAVNIQHIIITDSEMRRIDALGRVQIKRLAFTLLCLAKYWDIARNSTSHWVNSKDNEIMRMANITTSVKRQSEMYHTLNLLGMIQFSKRVDNTNVRVCFIEDGAPAMYITDFRNLGYQYLKAHGGPYFECQNCGITTKYKDPVRGLKQKYCRDCAAEIAIRQRVNSVMRKRASST